MRQVSVITAVAPEKAQFVKDTYVSLTAQVMPEDWAWQWIVQQDGPGNVHDLLPPDDPRISFGAGRRSGPAVTRNLALARAEGELVRVLDADDQLTPGALARDIDVLIREPHVGWTTSRVLDLLPDGSTAGFPFDPPPGPITRGAVLQHWLAHEYRAQVHPATLCMRRNLVFLLGGWMALPTSEDTGLLLALNAISTGYFIEQPGLLYRKWPGQTTASPEHTDPLELSARIKLIEARTTAILCAYPG
jgi:glycosyltransferase involved in cell wall biosynthesis